MCEAPSKKKRSANTKKLDEPEEIVAVLEFSVAVGHVRCRVARACDVSEKLAEWLASIGIEMDPYEVEDYEEMITEWYRISRERGALPILGPNQRATAVYMLRFVEEI